MIIYTFLYSKSHMLLQDFSPLKICPNTCVLCSEAEGTILFKYYMGSFSASGLLGAVDRWGLPPLPLLLVFLPLVSVSVPEAWSSVTLKLSCYKELKCHKSDWGPLMLHGHCCLCQPRGGGHHTRSPQVTHWRCCHFLGCRHAPSLTGSHLCTCWIEVESTLFLTLGFKNSQVLYVETWLRIMEVTDTLRFPKPFL